LLTLALSVFYFIWSGSYPLFVPDEGRYSEVAREMLVMHDYITPRLNGIVFLDKPILYYWLQAIAMKLFGINEWALRFWPILFGIIGCWITYFTGYILFNRRTAIVSALILATSPLYFGAAHYANLDLEVAVLISSSLSCFIMATRLTKPRQRQVCFFLSCIFAGLAVLTKGLIGLVFPITIIGSWIVLSGQWRILKNLPLIRGILLFTTITLPWYLLAQQANPEFFHFFFVTQQVTRFLSAADFNNKTAFWFYFPIVFAGFLPWSAFVIQAIVNSVTKLCKTPRAHLVELFLLLWLCIIFTFFSIPHSKTVGYILPIFPALALLTGHFLDQYWDNVSCKRIRYGIGLAMGLLLCSAILLPILSQVYASLIPPGFKHYLYEFAGIALATCLSLYITQRYNATLIAKFTCLTISSILLLSLLTFSAASLNDNTVKPLALKLKLILQPNDEIITYYKYYQDLPLYLEKRIVITADWKASDIANNDNWVRELWYGMYFRNSLASTKWLINEDEFWQRWNQKKRIFVLLNKNYLEDFQRKAQQNRYYLIDTRGNVMLFSNQS